MIRDYAELIVEAADQTGVAGVAQRAAMFVGQAEARLNKRLRVGEMEKTVTLTTDADGNAELPTDFIQDRGMAIGQLRMRCVQISDVDAGRAGFAVSGNTIITNQSESDLVLRYYAALPSLAESGTNWLLEADSDIYLYAVLQQIFLRGMDMEKATAAASYAGSLIDELEAQDSIKRFSGLSYQTAGVTP